MRFSRNFAGECSIATYLKAVLWMLYSIPSIATWIQRASLSMRRAAPAFDVPPPTPGRALTPHDCRRRDAPQHEEVCEYVANADDRWRVGRRGIR